MLIHDYEHVFGGRLPATLFLGEKADFTFAHDVEFSASEFTHIGLSDSFGRIHWCRRSEMKKALRAVRAYKSERPNPALE